MLNVGEKVFIRDIDLKGSSKSVLAALLLIQMLSSVLLKGSDECFSHTVRSIVNML